MYVSCGMLWIRLDDFQHVQLYSLVTRYRFHISPPLLSVLIHVLIPVLTLPSLTNHILSNYDCKICLGVYTLLCDHVACLAPIICVWHLRFGLESEKFCIWLPKLNVLTVFAALTLFLQRLRGNRL